MVLVSICIPTFNRREDLGRSVASALAQTHRDLEVVVSDNASSDGTSRWLAELASMEPRLQFVTAVTNSGPTENFTRAQRAAKGDFVMWLGDDDWLDPEFVERCLALLVADPTCVHAAGQVRYHPADGEAWDSAPTPLPQRDAARRVLAYYRSVGDNGVFYGLTRASALEGVQPMEAVMGGDWFYMAALAMRGTILVDTTVRVHRSVGGATTSLANVAKVGGYPGWHAVLPQPALVVGAVRHVLADRTPQADARSSRRLWLAVRVGSALAARLLPQAIGRVVVRGGDRLVRRRR